MRIIFTSIITSLLLCGCEKSSVNTIGNQELESRISILEKNLSAIRGVENNSAMFNHANAFTTNSEAFDKINQQLSFDNSRIEFMQTVVSNLINTINQQAGLNLQQNNQQTSPPVQIPANVINEIKAAAIQRFPDNIDKQNDMIKQEADAWYQLKQ